VAAGHRVPPAAPRADGEGLNARPPRAQGSRNTRSTSPATPGSRLRSSMPLPRGGTPAPTPHPPAAPPRPSRTARAPHRPAAHAVRVGALRVDEQPERAACRTAGPRAFQVVLVVAGPVLGRGHGPRARGAEARALHPVAVGAGEVEEHAEAVVARTAEREHP